MGVRQATARRQQNIALARDEWRRAGSLEDTPAEAHLAMRGIDWKVPGSIRFGDTGPENLWHRRFETIEACNDVFRALWRDSTARLPRLGRLIRSGGIAEFEAYISERVPEYEPNGGSPPVEDGG